MSGFHDRGACRRSRDYVEHADRVKVALNVPSRQRSTKLTKDAGQPAASTGVRREPVQGCGLSGFHDRGACRRSRSYVEHADRVKVALNVPSRRRSTKLTKDAGQPAASTGVRREPVQGCRLSGFHDRGACRRSRSYVEHADRVKVALNVPSRQRSTKLTKDAGQPAASTGVRREPVQGCGMSGFHDRGACRRSRSYVEHADRVKAAQGVPLGRRSRTLVEAAGLTTSESSSAAS